MGWFDEQIRQRKQNDNDVFEESFSNIAGAVMGGRVSDALNDSRQTAQDAIGEMLKYYHVKPREVPDNIGDVNEQLEYLLRPYGIMRRSVKLGRGWFRDADGAMLGVRKGSGAVTAFIPAGFSGYSFFDAETGKRVRLNRENQGMFEEEAIVFYKPFPLKSLKLSDFMRYIVETLSLWDYVCVAAATLAVTLIGMLCPRLYNILFSEVLASGSLKLLLSIAVFMVCVSVSGVMAEAVKSLFMARISTKLDIHVQAAAMSRVLSLPADFFKDYGSGELASRVGYINMLCNMLVSVVLSTGLTTLFSLLYLPQIFLYAPALVIPALLIIGATFLFTVCSALVQMRVSRQQMELSVKEGGMSYALISGVQKIKLSGAEKRAFARWGNLYAKKARLMYDPPVLVKSGDVIPTAISLAGTLVMYYVSIKARVSAADYYAFSTAYGMLSGAFISLSSVTLMAAQIRPVMEMGKPILKAVPENSADKQVITRITGGVELNNVSFRYNKGMPLVLDNLSLKIRPGQYVAIVGATGCGKSTLMRMMLGFETPQKGAVYYDGKDLASIDLKSLRRLIGVVMQDGKLFSGDIFSNITISAPWLTLEDAWRAAELAGIAEDIRRMPMGMNTMITEGSGGISGGQRQRLMIARAIAPRPRILMFDEATSALDNLTQKTVSKSLDGLKCTRIVIAHRLSTIRQCDRIIVLDKGRIIEDGTYEELMGKGGFFTGLVERQRLDDTEFVGKTTLF
ncbi:NHLP bacteriocin export ABC transporter permease/ATPase subunit [Blautia schinkii]|nr:NHLP bacteriocin export ABC transporter permease/ATPase subunit [Blautia schinkii]